MRIILINAVQFNKFLNTNKIISPIKHLNERYCQFRFINGHKEKNPNSILNANLPEKRP